MGVESNNLIMLEKIKEKFKEIKKSLASIKRIEIYDDNNNFLAGCVVSPSSDDKKGEKSFSVICRDKEGRVIMKENINNIQEITTKLGLGKNTKIIVKDERDSKKIMKIVKISTSASTLLLDMLNGSLEPKIFLDLIKDSCEIF